MNQTSNIVVPKCDGTIRYTTRELANNTHITLELLKEHKACETGVKWFQEHFPAITNPLSLETMVPSL